MSKKNMKELVKQVKELNELELTSDPIDVEEDDEDALKEEFIQAIEEIDDDGKIDEVDEDIIDFYESLIDGGGKGKKDKKEKDETPDDFDEDELREELEEFSVKEMKAYIEENDLDVDTKVKKSSLEDVIEEVVEAAEEAFEKAAKKAEKDKKGKGKKDKKDKKGKGKGKKDKKSKKDKKEKDVDLPKGLRKGTLPAKVYAAIGEDGNTLKKIAKVVAKEKGKDVDAVINLTLRTLIRKVSNAVPLMARFTGDEESVLITLAEDED